MATGTPQAATTKDTAVEMLSVPSPSPPGAAEIDGARRRGHGAAYGARMDATAPTSSSTVGLRVGGAPPR